LSAVPLQALNEKELGNVAYKAKKFDEALVHYNRAIELEPDNIVFYNNKSGTARWLVRYGQVVGELWPGGWRGQVVGKV